MQRSQRHIYLILFFIFGLNSAQTHRFYYELKYKSDSTKIESLKKIMVLDVNLTETKYYDDAFLEKDSINKKFNSQNTNWTDQIPLIRKVNSDRNTNFTMLQFQIYTYSTEDNISWILTNEIKKYQEFNLQKATTTFGGRKWTAWFTSDILFSEGPYKFRGLPGLIILLQDDKNQYIFSLIKSQNLKETYDTSNFLEVRYGNKPIPITEKIYFKKKMEYFNDPYYEIRENLRNGTTKSFENNGIKYTNANDLIPIIKVEQEYIIKHNNPIELNKALKYLK